MARRHAPGEGRDGRTRGIVDTCDAATLLLVALVVGAAQDARCVAVLCIAFYGVLVTDIVRSTIYSPQLMHTG